MEYSVVIQEVGKSESEEFCLTQAEFKRFKKAFELGEWIDLKMDDGEIIKINLPLLSSIRYKEIKEE